MSPLIKTLLRCLLIIAICAGGYFLGAYLLGLIGLAGIFVKLWLVVCIILAVVFLCREFGVSV